MDNKELLKRAFVEGWLGGHNVEDPHPVTERTAESKFEEWYEREVEE